MKLAIIGAGISGLTIARQLSQSFDVTVFDKSRGVGGRMATRSARGADGVEYRFDHGAQFFTARTDEFKSFLAPYVSSGLVQEWTGKVVTLADGKKNTKRLWFEPHFVACPHMTSLCKDMAQGLDVRLSTEVAPLKDRSGGRWPLESVAGDVLGDFDVVISTAPPAQTVSLFAWALPAKNVLEQARFHGCLTLMLAFSGPWRHPWIAAKVNDSALQWISVNSSKPGRDKATTCLVVHASHEWSDAHMHSDLEEVQRVLEEELERHVDVDCSTAVHRACHRWRYAKLHDSDREPLGAFLDPALGLAATGDWSASSRVEESWLSAARLAARLRSMVDRR